MAAINCPECNGLVGHGVRQCPHCGFDICKAELAKYAEELSKTREERIKKNFETLKPKMEEEISYRESFYNKHKIKYAERPSFIRQMFFVDGSQLTYATLIPLIISVIISVKTLSTLAILVAIASFVGFGFTFLAVLADYSREVENYENFQCGEEEQEVAKYIQKKHEEYQREAEYETDREDARLIDEYEEKHFDEEDDDDYNYSVNYVPKLSYSKDKDVPKCPICGSTDLTQISTVKKAAKVATFGIYGAGDIGKTWQCNNCKSKF